MCRARYEGGRRCPGCRDPARRALARIRWRLGRNDRAAQRANAAGDWEKVAHYASLLDRDVAQYEAATAAAQPPPAGVTRAAEFTPSASVDLTDDELLAACGDLHADPAAQEQIVATLEWREKLERQRDAELAEHRIQREREQAAAWAAAMAEDDTSPLTNPARRPARRLSLDQVCREEYDAHVHLSYLTAEDECRGHLLSREAENAGIHPITLFSGPASRARKHASEELRSWWARHGRITYVEWRHKWMGRESDRKAAATARNQSLGEAAMV